jgi:PASTA domain
LTKRSLLTAGGIALSISLGLAGGWLLHQPGPTRPVPRRPLPTPTVVTVPDVVDQSLNRASDVLREAGLVVSLNRISTSMYPTGRVVAQNPQAGVYISPGTTVQVRVFSPTPAVVRALRGQIDWDKSHLLDCWTALVRLLPRTGGPNNLHSILRTIPGELRTSIRSARTGRTLAHYVRNCESDAVA